MTAETLVGILLYLLVLCVYTPWLIWALRRRLYLRHPLVFFCFFGLFSQNAVGSIFVIFPELVARQEFYSDTFALMLIGQALLFYAITTPYLVFARRRTPAVYSVDVRVDTVHLLLLIGLSAIVVLRYVENLGAPPVWKAVTGELDGVDLIRYRIQQTYGLADYSLYHIGITVIPTLAAAITVAIALARRWMWLLLSVPVFIAVASIPGGKGSIIDVVSAGAVAYVFCRLAFVQGAAGPVALGRLAAVLVLAFVPIVVMYRVYYAELGAGGVALALLYRIVGVNSESMAAAVTYTRDIGLLEGATLPTIRGLLDHEYVNLSQEMHFYMFGPGGGAPISALAEGYVNFGMTGFVIAGVLTFGIVIAYEVVLLAMPRHLVSFALIVMYSVFATKIAQASIVATFISLTYAAFVVILYVSRAAIQAGATVAPRHHMALTSGRWKL